MTELRSELDSDGSDLRTVVSLRTYTFRWTIENFSKLPLNEKVMSSIFCPKLDWEYFATLEKSSSGCDLQLVQKSGPEIQMKQYLCIMNTAKNVLFHQFTSNCYESLNKVHSSRPYGFGSVTHLAKSSSCNVSSNFSHSKMKEVCEAAKDDVLTFKCVMEWGEVKTETNMYKFRPKPVSSIQNLSALSSDLKAMYGVSLYADVSLKVDDSVVRVHKSILCARSSVFQRMFMTPMGESEKNVIVISDLELQVLKDMLAFLYMGVLAKDDFESVYALYYAADKYDVSSLRKTCSDVLLAKLDVENACRVLALADRHSDVEFKEAVLEFIKFHHHEVLDTDAWGEFVENATLLASEVMALRGKKRKKTDEECSPKSDQ